MHTSGTATDYNDLFDKFADYLTLTGSAFGLTYAGTGTGSLTDYKGGASSVAETFTITATSSTNFTVTGSVSGSLPDATVGTPYSQSTIAFTITAGGTAFVSGDEFTLATAPKWVEKWRTRGARVLATAGNTGQMAAQNIVDGKFAVDNARKFRLYLPTFPHDFEFTFPEAETIASYKLAAFHTDSPAYMPASWTFDYWTGSAWSTLDTVSGETGWTSTEIREYTVDSPVAATKYRLHVTAGGSSNYLSLGAARLLRSSGRDAAYGAAIWEAPGNDGDSEILVGVHVFERMDADYFNWEIAGFDSYLTGSLFRQQAGYHGELFLPLWDEAIPYWFVVDGRRAIVVAKLNTQYEIGYLGFLDPYFTPEQWPYPLAIGGALALGTTLPQWHDTSFRWSNASNSHRALTHADMVSGPFVDEPLYSQMRARDISGLWRGFFGTVSDQPYYPDPVGNMLWPVCCGLSLLDKNLDDGYTLWPVFLNTFTPNTIGELRGVRVVSGQGLTAETLIAIGAVDWIVFHNIFRTDRDDFLAVALD